MIFDCIFCRIIHKEIPCSPIAETDDILVIKDINPKAPIHYLIIPKQHIQDIQSFADNQLTVARSMMLMARDLSKKTSNSSFKLVVNSGKEAGQSVFHVHFHYLAGKQFNEL